MAWKKLHTTIKDNKITGCRYCPHVLYEVSMNHFCCEKQLKKYGCSDPDEFYTKRYHNIISQQAIIIVDVNNEDFPFPLVFDCPCLKNKNDKFWIF